MIYPIKKLQKLVGKINFFFPISWKSKLDLDKCINDYIHWYKYGWFMYRASVHYEGLKINTLEMLTNEGERERPCGYFFLGESH